MCTEFSMKCKWDNSNLYVKTAGNLSQGAAESLSVVLLGQQNSVCRIFVDTVKLDVEDTKAAEFFRQSLVRGGMAGAKMFFKGKQGFALAVEGSRVLLTKKKACQCKTPCAVCKCAERSKQRRDAENGQVQPCACGCGHGDKAAHEHKHEHHNKSHHGHHNKHHHGHSHNHPDDHVDDYAALPRLAHA